jgi:hypothetical protein
MVYSGLVPMSPNTTPIAPRISVDLAPWLLPASLAADGIVWLCACSFMEILAT